MQEVQSRPAGKLIARQMQLVTDIGLTLPGFLGQFFNRYLFDDPARFRQLMGTVNVTTIGMCGTGNGYHPSRPACSGALDC
jgi:hypothetical protein